MNSRNIATLRASTAADPTPSAAGAGGFDPAASRVTLDLSPLDAMELRRALADRIKLAAASETAKRLNALLRRLDAQLPSEGGGLSEDESAAVVARLIANRGMQELHTLGTGLLLLSLDKLGGKSFVAIGEDDDGTPLYLVHVRKDSADSIDRVRATIDEIDAEAENDGS